MPSNHLNLRHPLLFPPSIFPSIKVFSNESVLYVRWPKYWSFSFSISSSKEYSGLIPLGLTGLISLLFKALSGEGNGTSLQYFCLKNPMDGGAGRLQSMGSLRVGHGWATSLSLFIFMHWRRKWHPTPVFLPGESQGWGSLVGCCLWGHTESDTMEVT